MATPKRPRRAAGEAPTKAAEGRATPPTMPDTYTAPTLTISADDSAPDQRSATPAPAASAKQIADGPTLIQTPSVSVPVVPSSATPRIVVPARSSSEAAQSATARSLASERAAMTRRRTMIVGGLAALLLIGALLTYRLLAPETPATPAPLAQATSAPAAQPTAAPAVQAQPTVAPAAQIQPTAAPAAQVQPTAAPQSGAVPAAIACAEIAGLPLFAGAACIENDTDQDNGVTEIKNTYRTGAAAADVGRFYEGSFGSNGWALQEFAYSVDLGARRLQVEVDMEQGASGPVTEVHLTERGAPGGTSSTCTAIDGLPSYPNATCSDFDTDQENGLIEAKNTYTTSASPEEVRRFYENAFKQNGWAGQEFVYGLMQGPRQLKVEIDPETGAEGIYTQIKVSAK